MTSIRRIASVAAAVMVSGLLSVIAPASALAAPGVCPGTGQAPIRVGQVLGASLEGVVVDGSGRLYTTDLVSGRVFRMDFPGGPAYPIATVPSGGAGALAFLPDGRLLVGYGADPRVFAGDVLRSAGIVALDVNTLAVTPFATGLSAANGLAVTRDGTVYATNDFASLIGQVLPSGAVNPAWASFPSANGAAIGADDRYLYVSRSFVNPGVSRIPIANPSAPESLVNFSGLDAVSIADGLTVDSGGSVVVPTDITGDILRIDAPGASCTIASGLPLSSVITYGNGSQGFSAGRLFRAGFDGAIYEIPGGRT
ncbi:SMP-30/gluconolactonase/LRE family protein [Actinomycetes bacterium M1A6_2h]